MRSMLHGRTDGKRKAATLPKRRWMDDTIEWSRLSVADCITLVSDKSRQTKL